MSNKLITIDGASATGKGTIAKKLAQHLGWKCFDTGAMYRCLAYFIMTHYHSSEKLEDVKKAIEAFSIVIAWEDGAKYIVNGEVYNQHIRSMEVSKLTSKLAALPIVREFMVEKQRAFANTESAVFEGRDMGSVVFPQAPLKVFLDASLEVRAKRRQAQLKEKNPDFDLDLEFIKDQIQERDERDSSRETSPLVIPENALVIDTSSMSIDEVSEHIIKTWEQILASLPS